MVSGATTDRERRRERVAITLRGDIRQAIREVDQGDPAFQLRLNELIQKVDFIRPAVRP